MAWRGHISKNIKELRILMCQSSPASSSARFIHAQWLLCSTYISYISEYKRSFYHFSFCLRAFVEKNYKELKTLNPKLPILVRECSGVEPQLWARYGMNHLKSHFCLFLFGFVYLKFAFTFYIMIPGLFPP